MVLHKFVDEDKGFVTCVKIEEDNGYVTYWTNNGSRRHDLRPQVWKTTKENWDKMVKEVNNV